MQLKAKILGGRRNTRNVQLDLIFKKLKHLNKRITFLQAQMRSPLINLKRENYDVETAKSPQYYNDYVRGDEIKQFSEKVEGLGLDDNNEVNRREAYGMGKKGKPYNQSTSEEMTAESPIAESKSNQMVLRRRAKPSENRTPTKRTRGRNVLNRNTSSLEVVKKEIPEIRSPLNEGELDEQHSPSGHSPSTVSIVNSSPDSPPQSPAAEIANKISQPSRISDKFKCQVCEKVLKNSQTLANHLKIHTDVKPFRCSHCSKLFIRKDHLVTHERVHTREKPYSCNFCSVSFSHKSALNRHASIHTCEKPYKCFFCSKSFRLKESLEFHFRTHTHEKPYKCGICKKDFPTSSHRTAHQKSHHDTFKELLCK